MDKTLDFTLVVGQNRKLLFSFEKTGKMARQTRPLSCRVRDRGGKFGGMGRAQDNERALGCVRLCLLTRGAHPDGGVRVGQEAGFSPALGDLLCGFGLGNTERIELGANSMKRAGLDRKPLLLPQPRH
jgi:hypothetical protein